MQCAGRSLLADCAAPAPLLREARAADGSQCGAVGGAHTGRRLVGLSPAVVGTSPWMMVITRIRNIAEHAVVPDSDDPLRNTRTTEVNLIERIFIAPYFVNYHLEHHLLFYIPC